MKELSNLQFALILMIPVIIFLTIIIVYPLIYALWASFHEIMFLGGLRISYVGINNYTSGILTCNGDCSWNYTNCTVGEGNETNGTIPPNITITGNNGAKKFMNCLADSDCIYSTSLMIAF